mgnify:CR=1 FL=1
MKSLILSFFILCAGCFCGGDDDEPRICTEQFVYGLNVTITNASDNAVIIEGIVVIATDGDYNEILINHPNTDSFVGAGERPGNYSISVTGEGFESFTSDVVTVDMTSDNCHVIPETVEISLGGI